MDLFEEFGRLFVALGPFMETINDDDDDLFLLLQYLFRRRNNLVARLLQRQRVIVQRIQEGREVYFGEYVGNWFHRYPARQFKKDFRFTKEAFERLIIFCGPAITGERYGYHGLPVRVKLIMLLWTLANRESFRVLSRRFCMNPGNVHYIVMKTCRAIITIADRFIRWPNRDEYEGLSQHFNLPNTIGTVDASEIEIRQPLQQLQAYTSRKCKTTIKVQVVSTWNLKFLDVSVGWPGSMHDGRIFRNSSLSTAIRLKFADSDHHIIADTAYRLLPQVLTPFRNRGHLEDHELEFNRVLKSDRQMVERSIGLVKMKFRRLKYLDVFSIKNAHTIVLVSACLHNFGTIYVDDWDDGDYQNIDEDENDHYEFDVEEEEEGGLGFEKRRHIAEQMRVHEI